MSGAKLRDIADGPWCWLNKEALNHIERATDSRSDRVHILSVYLTLCRIASNKTPKGGREAAFQASKGEIATRSGISPRKAFDALKFLRDVGLVAISENKIQGTDEQGPNTYAMLPPCTACTTPCIPCTTPCTDASRGSVPSNRRTTLKNTNEEQELNTLQGAEAPALVLTSSEEKKPRKQRPRDLVFDALATVDGSNLNELTSQAAGKCAKALKVIREVCPDVTADEIRRRAAAYRAKFPKASITPTAISGNWASLGAWANQNNTQKPACVPDNQRFQDEE